MDFRKYLNDLRKLDEVLGPDGTDALLQLAERWIESRQEKAKAKGNLRRPASSWIFLWMTLGLSVLAILLHLV